jgi:hypothetical protein
MRIDEAAVQRNQEASAIKLGFGLSSKPLWFGEIPLEWVSVFLPMLHPLQTRRMCPLCADSDQFWYRYLTSLFFPVPVA